jgi:hypothetical protein
MLALAGEIADGAIPILVPPQHTATAPAPITCGWARSRPTSRQVSTRGESWPLL